MEYETLLKAELLALLYQRDSEIQNFNNTAESIITSINTLPDTEKKALPIFARTTENGVKAYVTFLYGTTESLEQINENILNTEGFKNEL